LRRKRQNVARFMDDACENKGQLMILLLRLGCYLPLPINISGYAPVLTPHERKQLHESEYNSHENKMVPTTSPILAQTSRLLIAN